MQMITIGICDDELIYREHLKEIIEVYLAERGMNAEVMEFQDGSELMSCDTILDILFLDIEMKTMSGIKVKEEYAKNQVDSIIIFTSSHSEYTREMIGRNVYHFLEKPIEKEHIYQVMDDVCPELKKDKIIELEDAGEVYLIDYSKIKYIIAQDKYTRVFMEEEEYLLRKNMKYWKDVLPENQFCEINRSVIVSFSHFVKSGDSVKLDNGELVKFSRKRKEEIMNRYRRYLREL